MMVEKEPALATRYPCGRGMRLFRLIWILAIIVATLAIGWQSADAARGNTRSVLVIDIDDQIDPLSVDYISRGLDEARSEAASLVVIRLDTPGGLLQSTREIVELMFESHVPIAVYVAPAGARAASAGTFLLAASNFAVMAPGTSVGAASPVGSGGTELPTTLSRKVSEGTQAFIRSIAEVRRRNAAALEVTVSKAVAYSAQEALDIGIVDLVAPDMQTLLNQLHGRSAETAGGRVIVSTADVTVHRTSRTLVERVVEVLANPNVVLALFLIGGLGVLVELSSPGLIAPGTVGIIASTLGLVGFLNLPGSWGGLLLIAIALGLFYAESVAPGFSVFGAGGIVALLFGSIFLFGNYFSPSDLPEPSYMVSPVMIAITTAVAVVAWVLFIRFVRAEGGTSGGFQTEEEMSLEGAWGVATSDLEPSGKVRVADQEWAASTDPGNSIRAGDEIRVQGVYGQVLKVEKLYQKRRR